LPSERRCRSSWLTRRWTGEEYVIEKRRAVEEERNNGSLTQKSLYFVAVDSDDAVKNAQSAALSFVHTNRQKIDPFFCIRPIFLPML
jgi:hypothetical protein